MTQEEKLLLRDLCARLYTDTIVNYNDIEGCDYKLTIITLSNFPEEKLKCYLRPMSDMTEEEKKEIGELLDASIEIDTDGNISYFSGSDFIPRSDYQIYIDYLISHHFDYRGLIPMGLALPAPKGMYKYI